MFMSLLSPGGPTLPPPHPFLCISQVWLPYSHSGEPRSAIIFTHKHL